MAKDVEIQCNSNCSCSSLCHGTKLVDSPKLTKSSFDISFSAMDDPLNSSVEEEIIMSNKRQ